MEVRQSHGFQCVVRAQRRESSLPEGARVWDFAVEAGPGALGTVCEARLSLQSRLRS